MGTLSTTWNHIRRSPYQSIAAILTMFLTFLLGGIFALASLTSVIVLQFFESKPQITVFFSDSAKEADAQTLKDKLEQTGKIASLKYVSKDDALAIYKEQNKNDPLLLEMVTADILPASLEVSAQQPQFLRELEPIIKESPNVEEVVYQRDVVDTLLSWTNAIRITGGTLAGLLAVDSILIITTVIGMKIALRKEEIDILKLVGASPGYIRFPFVLEGAAYGVIGAVSAWAIIMGLLIWARPLLLTFLGVIPLIHALLVNPLSNVFILSSLAFLEILTLVGFLLGCFGSFMALGRYLKF